MQNKSTYFRSHFLVVAVEGKALFCMFYCIAKGLFSFLLHFYAFLAFLIAKTNCLHFLSVMFYFRSGDLSIISLKCIKDVKQKILIFHYTEKMLIEHCI